MNTLTINKHVLSEASFLWQQKRLKQLGDLQDKLIDKEMSKWLFPARSRIQASIRLDKQPGEWQAIKWDIKMLMREFRTIHTACRVAEGDVITIGMETVAKRQTCQKIFGENDE